MITKKEDIYVVVSLDKVEEKDPIFQCIVRTQVLPCCNKEELGGTVGREQIVFERHKRCQMEQTESNRICAELYYYRKIFFDFFFLLGEKKGKG